MRWWIPSPSASCCGPRAASRAAWASCCCCPSAPWRCWPATAMPSSWPRWRRLPCWCSRCSCNLRHGHRRQPIPRRGRAGRRHLHRRAVGAAAGQPPDRKRGAGAPAGSGPRQPGAAVAVHRAAPAREHPRGGRGGPHPADQRVRRPRSSAMPMPGPARCWASARRACCSCWPAGASMATRRRPAPSPPQMARD